MNQYIYLDTNILITTFFSSKVYEYIEKNGKRYSCRPFSEKLDSLKQSFVLPKKDMKYFWKVEFDLKATRTLNLFHLKLKENKDEVLISSLSTVELYSVLKRKNIFFKSEYINHVDKKMMLSAGLGIGLKLIPNSNILNWKKFHNFIQCSPVIKDEKGRKRNILDYIHLYYVYSNKIIKKKGDKNGEQSYFLTDDKGILSVKEQYAEGPLKFDRIQSLSDYVKMDLTKRLKSEYGNDTPADIKICSLIPRKFGHKY